MPSRSDNLITTARGARTVALAILMSLVASVCVRAEDDLYLRDVKPVLKQRCYACHGPLKQESDLRLDSAKLLKKGGQSGPAFVVGKPEESLILERITATDDAERMPPEGEPLTAEQIQAIRQWIAEGADAPQDEKPEEDPTQHWAFQPITRPPYPGGTPADTHPVDAFLNARLQAQGLASQPPASKAVLLRRIYLDLIGLPPTREELRRFLDDDSDDAYARVVDHLLQDPRYGERWGRHWMDVWRYSDWYGRRRQNDVRNSAGQIWRWRDWIIRSLNQDRGYDEMVRAMLAADEMFSESPDDAVATGFLIRNYYSLNPNDWMRSNVEHTAKAFLGLTFNCAHCHDHKYDPITQDNYFQFRAFFEPISIRQDRIAGQADPGLFAEYKYGGSRTVQRLGLVRIYDKSPKATTWFYSDGDERNRDKERGSIPPGVPDFLADVGFELDEVALPPVAWYPGLHQDMQQALIADAEKALRDAEQALEGAKPSEPSAEDQQRLAKAEAALANTLASKEKNGLKAIGGKQSLLLDAREGRRIVQNPLAELKEYGDGFSIEFTLRIVQDAHVNFQLARDSQKGLTAAYFAFVSGRIVTYRPDSFTEFDAGKYDFVAGQNSLKVRLQLKPSENVALLSVESLHDGKLLVPETPAALNGWNPLNDETKTISFDARPGSQALIDDVAIRSPKGVALAYHFEGPTYQEGADIVGLEGWKTSRFGVAPAISKVVSALPDPEIDAARQKVAAVKRQIRAGQLVRLTAQAKADAAKANLESLKAKIRADLARYSSLSNDDAAEWITQAAQSERQADLLSAKARLLVAEKNLADAQAKAAADTKQAKAAGEAQKALTVAQNALKKAEQVHTTPVADYRPLTPQYPKTSTGRRRALAAWIANDRNPLTARVAVNHIWLRHFHKPLVASVYDFGRNGQKPTHPQLLDWLAAEFIASGWSMKDLHRLLVTSDAYQRSSSRRGAAKQQSADVENQLLWRMNTGRMEAEVVRDSLLYCGNLLSLDIGGQESENPDALKTFRRSLYYSTYPEQGGANALGVLFDAPDPLDCYRRTQTIVPQQALALTNSEFVFRSVKAVVDGLEQTDANTSTDGFVVAAFETVLARSPNEKEVAACRRALEAQVKLAGPANAGKPETIRRARESLVRALFNHNDFVTIR